MQLALKVSIKTGTRSAKAAFAVGVSTIFDPGWVETSRTSIYSNTSLGVFERPWKTWTWSRIIAAGTAFQRSSDLRRQFFQNNFALFNETRRTDSIFPFVRHFFFIILLFIRTVSSCRLSGQSSNFKLQDPWLETAATRPDSIVIYLQLKGKNVLSNKIMQYFHGVIKELVPKKYILTARHYFIL